MKILVVEDETLALDDLLDMLRPLGDAHTVVGCTSGAAALAEAEERPPDLVITDIRMPEIDGIELVRRLKARRPGLAAVVLSGHSEFEYARESMRLGIADYLLKPVRTEALLRTVSTVIAGIAEERAQVTELREARLVRLLLGGQRAAEAEPELLAGQWGVIITVCENWESPVVWRDTPVSRELMVGELTRAGLGRAEVVGIDGHIRVLLAPLAGISPLALGAAAERLHRAIGAAGVVAHTAYAVKAAGQAPAALVSEEMRRLGRGMRFAAPTMLGPDERGEPAAGAAREQARLVERAIADGKLPVAVSQIHATLAMLRRDGATQASLVEAIDGLLQLLRRHPRHGEARPLPDRAAIAAALRRLRSYDELAAWVDGHIQPMLEQERGSITPRQLVRLLVARVHASYADDISLQAFAAEHGVSMAYFSRLFKEEVGMTFSDYLGHIRIERAKELLARGDLRPAEISALVGYEDPKYFGQVFRKAVGVSPIDYQRGCQAEP